MTRRNPVGRWILCVPLMLLVFAGQAPAQMITGEISGTIQDSSGAIIPDATVTITNEATGAVRTTSSMANGEFVLTALRPGTYTVKVEKTGFKTYERTGNVLTPNQRVALGAIPMAVGQVTQTVEVTAQQQAINTENADTAVSLSSIQVTELGVKGRDVMQLLRVLPGVTTLTVVPWGEMTDTDPAGTGANGGQFGSFTPGVGGARLFWNTVTVDGQVGSNPDFPGLFEAATSMDAVSEVKIVSNNYTADYGRNPGSTIAVITKSGTKDFHGTVYGYKRSEKLNANDFFDNLDGLPKPIFRYGTFGFAVGGPVYIPGKLNSNKEKLFFFYSQEDWDVHQPWGINRITVPTAAERQGDFSQSFFPGTNLTQPITITDPTTHQPFTGNKISSDRINPQGQLLLNLMPLPNYNNPSVPYNYVWQDVCDIPRLLQSLKLDYHASTKDTFTLSGRRWWVDTRAYGCRVLGFAGDIPFFKHHYEETTDTILWSWTRIINPTVVNEFNIGFVGEKERSPATNLFGRTQANYFDAITRTNAGFTLGQLFPAANTYDFLPAESFTFIPNAAYVGPDDSRLPDNQGYPRFNTGDNLSWTHNSHTLKFGVYWERSWATDGKAAGCFSGCFDFSHDVYNPLDTGWDFSNALLGNFKSYSEANARKFYLMTDDVVEWFAQDTWKVNKKLTLTYGVRFARFTPWHIDKGQGAEFVPSRYDPAQVPPYYRPVQDPSNPTGPEIAYNPATGAYAPAVYIGAFTSPFNYSGMVLSTDKSYPTGFRFQHAPQVEPRFGFAYDPFGNGKTAIRGGFALMKEETPSYSTTTWGQQQDPPVQVQETAFYGNMSNLLSRSGLVFPTAGRAIQENDKVPSVYRYSLGFERQFGLQTTADVSYVGNVGRHEMQSMDLNELPYAARFQPSALDPSGNVYPDDFLRPIPGYESLPMLINAGISSYNSLQVMVNRRISNGVSFGVSYTYSHTLNNGNSEGDTLPTYLPSRGWVYGPANFDQTHMFVVNYVWDLPKPSHLVDSRGAKLFVGSVLDNWQLSGVTTMASGLPQPLYCSSASGLDFTGGGDGSRCNVIARPELAHGSRTFNEWFNTAAFAMPALPQGTTFDHGNASVAPFRGPGQNNFDITLTKKFPLKSETRSLLFRAESYNAFNHTQFQAVDNNAVFNTDPTAGAVGAQVNTDFGHVTATRQPRVIQLSLRFDF